jgi:two-component system sensor histidine kinase VicK
VRLMPRRLADIVLLRDRQRAQSWWIVTVSLGGLLVAITVAHLVALAITRNVQQITENVLEQDVKLEDVGDDLRVAVLDVRHYYRDLLFNGVTPGD